MPFSHTISRNFSSGSSTITSSNTFTGGQEVNLEETIPDNSTNMLVNAALDVSTMQSLYLACDVAITIKTNSSNAPAASISLTAGQALIWPNGGADNPFGATDVTKFYVTGPATGGTFQMRALLDPTP